MGLLRIRVGNKVVEYETTDEKGMKFMRELAGVTPPAPHEISRTAVDESEQTKKLSDQEKIKIIEDKWPRIKKEDIKTFILSNPSYKHYGFEVHKNFFGFPLKGRGVTKNYYRQFNELLEDVRKDIEEEKKGKFDWKQYSKGTANYKVYTFKPIGGE